MTDDGTTLTAGEILLYQTEDGRTLIQCLQPDATIRRYRIVRTEGNREVSRNIEHYGLDTVLAIGFRVPSHRGTRFAEARAVRPAPGEQHFEGAVVEVKQLEKKRKQSTEGKKGKTE